MQEMPLMLAHGRASFVTVGGSDQKFLDADPNRLALYVGSNNAQRVTLSNQGTAVIDEGPTIQAGAAGQMFYGEFAASGLRAVAGAGGTKVGIVEYVFD